MPRSRISRKFRKQAEREFADAIAAKDAEIAQAMTESKAANERALVIQQQLEEERSRIDEYVRKLSAITTHRDPHAGIRGRTRLVLDIDEAQLQLALEWGNDARFIELIGQRLGREASRVMFQSNMRRTG